MPPRLLVRRSMSLQDLSDGLAMDEDDEAVDAFGQRGRGWRRSSTVGQKPPLRCVTASPSPKTTGGAGGGGGGGANNYNTLAHKRKDIDDFRRFSAVSTAVETELPRQASFHSLTSREPSDSSACSGRLSAHPVIESDTITQTGQTSSGDKIINDYIVLGTLGKGSYSKVKLCKSVETNETCAMKVYKKSLLKHVGRLGGRGSQLTTALQKIKQEIAILKKLRHRNLIQLYAVLDDADGDKMILVMEYAIKGSIGEVDSATGYLINKPLTEDLLAHYFLGVVSGLRYLHKCGVVHRDIKPENILIDAKDVAKLSDFGVSHVFHPVTGDVLLRTEGTPAYFPPEACVLNSQDGYGGVAGDIWALGVTILTLYSGQHPFHCKDRNTLRQSIQKDQPVIPATASQRLSEMLQGLLKKDHRWRPSLKEVFYHPFFREREPMSPEGVPLGRTGRMSFSSGVGLDRRGSRGPSVAGAKLKSPGDYSIDLAFSIVQPSDRSESIPSVQSTAVSDNPSKYRSPNGTEEDPTAAFDDNLSPPTSPPLLQPDASSECNEEPDPPIILSTDVTDAITIVRK